MHPQPVTPDLSRKNYGRVQKLSLGFGSKLQVYQKARKRKWRHKSRQATLRNDRRSSVRKTIL
jgi:hypothetical protein